MDRKENTEQSQQQQQHYNPGRGLFIHNPNQAILGTLLGEPKQVSLSAEECTSRAARCPPYRNNLPPIAAFHNPPLLCRLPENPC